MGFAVQAAVSLCSAAVGQIGPLGQRIASRWVRAACSSLKRSAGKYGFGHEFLLWPKSSLFHCVCQVYITKFDGLHYSTVKMPAQSIVYSVTRHPLVDNKINGRGNDQSELLEKRTGFSVSGYRSCMLAAGGTQLIEGPRALRLRLGRPASARTPSDKISVIAIDKRSIDNIGRWPWSREIHAKMIDRLADAKAKVIATRFFSPSRSSIRAWSMSTDFSEAYQRLAPVNADPARHRAAFRLSCCKSARRCRKPRARSTPTGSSPRASPRRARGAAPAVHVRRAAWQTDKPS